ncbi:MAG: DUF4912 domain-containing protein [Candidatus Sericytochromatia bacterium]
MSNDKAKSDKNNNKDKVEKKLQEINYPKLTKLELTNIAKSYELKNISSLSKDELINKIKEYKNKQEKLPDYKKSPYSEYSKQQLNDLAKGYKIKNYSRLSKVDLIKAIDRYEEQNKNIEEKTDSIEEQSNEKKENNLGSLNMTSLVSMAKDLKIKGYSKLSKLKLIKSINELKDNLSNKVEEIKESLSDNISLISENLTETKTNLIDKAQEIKESLTENVTSISENITETKNNVVDKISEIKENLVESRENISDKISKTKDTINYIVSEMKDAFNKDPNEFDKVEEKEKIDKTNVDNLTNAETIEKIAQKTELTFVDRREANAIEEELRHKILLTPSKFGFGKTNEEYLLKDEENLELPKLYEEDKITLLPVDPTRMFTYWDISTETINKFIENNIRDFYLKVNDVTGILYNGSNANIYWMEKCNITAGDWYIYLNQGGRNYCVEIGYIYNGEFNIIARSNTITVALGKSSDIVLDTFVIATYPKLETRSKDINKELASDKYISREIKGRKSPYFELNDYTIAGNYNLRKMPQKMPIFNMIDEEIPQHFVEEYKIQNEKFIETEFKQEEIHYNPPEKLKSPPSPIINENFIEKKVNYNDDKFIVEIENKEEDYYKNKSFKSVSSELSNNQDIKQSQEYFYELPVKQLEQKITNPEPLKYIQKDIPQAVYSYFEAIPNFDKNKILIDSYYYQLPNEPQKAIRVYYEWIENETPYRKEFFWISDVFPEVHQNIYKISWGPTWVKEFVGGSEQIRYIGASERFLGSSDIYLGGSEYFIESSGRYLGASEYLFGDNEEYSGGSEKYIGASDNLGGSENFHNMDEIVNIFSNELIPKNFKVKTNEYKGIKDRYRL